MKVIDSDIFVIAARYPRDVRAHENEQFLSVVRENAGEFATTIFNKLEVIGELSFGMSEQKFERFWDEFERHFGVAILFPHGITTLTDLVEEVRTFIKRKMALGDALVLLTAESHPDVDTFVTWNAKHFKGKTRLKVVTPVEFLRQR